MPQSHARTSITRFARPAGWMLWQHRTHAFNVDVAVHVRSVGPPSGGGLPLPEPLLVLEPLLLVDPLSMRPPELPPEVELDPDPASAPPSAAASNPGPLSLLLLELLAELPPDPPSTPLPEPAPEVLPDVLPEPLPEPLVEPLLELAPELLPDVLLVEEPPDSPAPLSLDVVLTDPPHAQTDAAVTAAATQSRRDCDTMSLSSFSLTRASSASFPVAVATARWPAFTASPPGTSRQPRTSPAPTAPEYPPDVA